MYNNKIALLNKMYIWATLVAPVNPPFNLLPLSKARDCQTGNYSFQFGATTNLPSDKQPKFAIKTVTVVLRLVL